MLSNADRRILHILGQHFYEREFYKLVAQHPELREGVHHVFLFQGNRAFSVEECADITIRFSNDRLGSLEKLKLFQSEGKQADIIIFHGLWFPKIQLLYAVQSRIARKSRWVLWGGDLYNDLLFPDGGLKARLKRGIKSKLIKKIEGIIALVPGDYAVVKENYATNSRLYKAFYPLPVNFKLLDRVIAERKPEERRVSTILLGNSASKTNEHFEAIDFLTKLSNKEFNVLCPLSYGDMEYAKKVIEYGKTKLGSRFEPLTEYMKPEDYAKVLNTVDAAIMNHKRQQAVGNIVALLYLGKKVFLRQEVTTYSWLRDMGITVFDIDEILGAASDDIFYIEPDKAIANREIIKEYFSEENCVKLWKRIFDS